MNEILKKWLLATMQDRQTAIRRLCLANAVRQIRERAHGNKTQIIRDLVKDHNSSLASVYRYIETADEALKGDAQYKTLAQLVALLPDYSYNKAVTYSFDIDSIEWALTKYCESPGMSISRVYSSLKIEAKKKEWQTGSIDTLRRIFAYYL